MRTLSTVFLLLVGLIASIWASPLPEAKGLSAGKLDQPTVNFYAGDKLAACPSSDSCTVSGDLGACVNKTAGCCTGTSTAGHCPGSSDIQCCTMATCSTPSGNGKCMSTSACSASGGTSLSGYCSGPSDLRCCVTGVVPEASTLGYDIATALSASSANCYQSSGYSFAIPRGFRSTGAVDTNVCTSIKAAKNAGAKVRDTYMFPCPTCSASASSQLNSLLSYVKTNCPLDWSGRIWLDIEGKEYWSTSTSSNQAWYKALVDACTNSGARCGIYSSASQWSAIFGSTSFSYGASNPLWYAHYDGKATFSDFSSFGGWSAPHAKQYNGDVTVCSIDTDVNYAPSF